MRNNDLYTYRVYLKYFGGGQKETVPFGNGLSKGTANRLVNRLTEDLARIYPNAPYYYAFEVEKNETL